MRISYLYTIALISAGLIVALQACTKQLDNEAAFDASTSASHQLQPDPAPAKYLTYDGTGAQNNLANYNSLATAPTNQPVACPGAAGLCWIKVNDVDEDGDVDAADFTATFNALDADLDGTLDDETEVAGTLEKRQ